MQSKLTSWGRGADFGPGIQSNHRDVAGITTRRPGLEGGCRLGGVMNISNCNDFSTRIMISKFRSAIFSDFQRFSAIFANFDEKHYDRNLIFSQGIRKVIFAAPTPFSDACTCPEYSSDRIPRNSGIFLLIGVKVVEFQGNRGSAILAIFSDFQRFSSNFAENRLFVKIF